MPRPSSYSRKIDEKICDFLAEGFSLVKICEMPDMPNRSTVMRWMAAEDDFATRCAHARALQADLMDDMILDVANASKSETAASDRVKISAYQWRASKLAPKKYGDKLDLNVSGKLETIPEDQIEARIAELIGKAGATATSRGAGSKKQDE